MDGLRHEGNVIRCLPPLPDCHYENEAAYWTALPRAALNSAELIRIIAKTAIAYAADTRRCPSEEWAAQAEIAREVFGNPFRAVSFDHAWLTSDMTALAAAAYENRILPSGELVPHRLAILADALEESGAADAIVSHLRSPGPHVRGCWALDLCHGKS